MRTGRSKLIQNPIEAWEECPKADFCDINKCILRLDYNKLKNFPDDYSIKNKQRCIPKSVRVRIATKWKLANGGLNDRERRGKERWDAMPQEEKMRKINKLHETGFRTVISAKEPNILRKIKLNTKKHDLTPQNREIGPSDLEVLPKNTKNETSE